MVIITKERIEGETRKEEPLSRQYGCLLLNDLLQIQTFNGMWHLSCALSLDSVSRPAGTSVPIRGEEVKFEPLHPGCFMVSVVNGSLPCASLIFRNAETVNSGVWR